MPEEVIRFLNLKPGSICVDCTLGGSGHAADCLKSVLPDGRLIGIDQDVDAIKNAERVFQGSMEQVSLVHENFSKLPEILASLGIDTVDGILLDLGLSLNQIRHSKRGFSFNSDEPLDMRMDTRQSLTASDMVNSFAERDLADLFFQFGEEKFSRRVARQIVSERNRSPIKTSRHLAGTVEAALKGRAKPKQKIHPATRVFQALRIAVNKELERLEHFMENVPDLLNPNGRLVAISFHSLEDRIIKKKIQAFEKGCQCPKTFPQCVCNLERKLVSVVKKPVTPSEREVAENPMARSAKMRVAEKI